MKILLCDNRMSMLLNFRMSVIRHFLERGWDVLLVYPSMSHCKALESRIPAQCCTVTVDVDTSGTDVLKDVSYMRSLLAIYRREKPDVVFHYTIKPNIYGTIAARLARVPYTVAMVAGLGYVFSGNDLNKRLARLLYKIGLRLSDRVITLNESNRNLLVAKGYVRKKNMEFFDCGEGVELSMFPRKNTGFKCVRFLMVGRVLYDKGYKEFVKAARIVKLRHPEVSFELLGPVDEESPMRVSREVFEKDMAEGTITYLGVTDDVPTVVGRDGVVLVVASYHEGLNRSLMEACAMGRPAIASNIPGCRELVEEGGNGFLVEPKSPEQLVAAMERFISLSREQKIAMGEVSYRKAIEQFDVRITLRKYDEILSSLGVCK